MEDFSSFQSVAVQPLKSRSKFEAIKEIIETSPVFSRIKHKKDLEKAVICREKILSTGLGHEVAIAHGKTQEIEKTYIALGISKEGIFYDSPDGKLVKLLFIIVSPLEKYSEYICILSSLAKLVSNENLKQEILKSEGVEQAACKLDSAFRSIVRRSKIASDLYWAN